MDHDELLKSLQSMMSDKKDGDKPAPKKEAPKAPDKAPEDVRPGQDALLATLAAMAEKKRGESAEAPKKETPKKEPPKKETPKAEPLVLDEKPVPAEEAPKTTGRRATSAETESRRETARRATTEETESRRDSGRRATSAETESRRDSGRRATSAETESRRDTGRRATSAETESRRDTGRRATSAETESRRGGGTATATAEDVVISDKTFGQVFSRVNSCPEPETFRQQVGQLQVIYGESGTEYRVTKVLSQEGGEAAVLLCEDPKGNKVVAKVFIHAEGKGQHTLQAREKVFRFMQTDAGKRAVLAVSDYGTATISGAYHHYFEIMPYCAGGDMLGMKLSFKELLPVIRELNESLHAIHEAGIIHLDLKPDNLYLMSDGTIRIGDFGVARSTETGGRMATSTVVGTDGYRAPETVTALTAGKAAYVLGGACDYYSLGVTIASLYEGRFAFEGLDAATYAAAVQSGHIPLDYRDSAREQQEQELLYHLLDGLVRYTPDSRFDYQDVLTWLDDHEYTGATAENMWPKPFRFKGKDLRDSRQVFEALTESAANWDEAKAFLYEGDFNTFFPSFWPELARTARKTAEYYRGNQEDFGLAVFLKALYPVGPIVWRGYTWKSLAELGQKMVGTSTPKAYGQILAQRILSHWLENTVGITVTQENIDLVKDIETMAQKNPELACFWFGYAFSGAKQLELGGKQVKSMQALFDVLFADPVAFYAEGGYYEMLMDSGKGAKIYGFLASYGYGERITKLLDKIASGKEYDRYELMLSGLETMGDDSKVKMDGFRKFYLEFGPVGYAYYICKFQKERSCYVGITETGRELIAKLSGFTLPKPGAIETTRKKMQPLLETVDRLEKQMQNNPYLATAGVYGTCGIACKNLAGYFCYNVFGRKAPLGFGGLIEK